MDLFKRVLGGVALLVSFSASAIPANPQFYCDQYPDSPACERGPVSCFQCHAAPFPDLNPYGLDLVSALENYPEYDGTPASFEMLLPSVLPEIESLDSDEDGVSNGDEITNGTAPGVAN